MDKNYVDNCYKEVIASLIKARDMRTGDARKKTEETIAKAREMYESYKKELG